jgi:lipopolysaccharide exporter
MMSLYERLRKQISELTRSGFLRHVATLSSGVLLAQVVQLGAAPVLTRLYSPTMFGVLAAIASVTAVMTAISSLCYDRAIVLPKGERDAVSLVLLSLVLVLTISALSALVALAFGVPLAERLGDPSLAPWLWIGALIILARGVMNVLAYWHTRLQLFRYVAASQVVRALVDVGVKIGLGFLVGASALGLLTGTSLGFMAALLYLMWRSKGTGLAPRTQGVDLASIRANGVTYRKYPVYETWNTFLDSLSKEIVVFLFTWLYSPAVVGLYHLGLRVLQQPVTFVGSSVGRVFLQRAAVAHADDKPLLRSLTRATAGLAAVAALPFAALTLFGQPLFAWFFGSDWQEAGLYVQILSPWLFFVLINRPAHGIYMVLQKLEILLVFNVGLVSARAGAIVLGYALHGTPVASLIYFSVVGVLANLLFIGAAFLWTSRSP